MIILYAIFSECQVNFAIFSEYLKRSYLMDLKERIQELCKRKNISMNQLEQELGFGKGYISKLGKSTPNATKIQQIAQYLDVTVDYLMRGKDDSERNDIYSLPSDIRAIARGAQDLSPSKRELLLKLIQSMSDSADEELEK
jgi:transcriptional regulator with XRE-family HTH domain